MPYTIAYEVLKGRIRKTQKESADGALKLVEDIRQTGMNVVSITHSSGQEVPIQELQRMARLTADRMCE